MNEKPIYKMGDSAWLSKHKISTKSLKPMELTITLNFKILSVKMGLPRWC